MKSFEFVILLLAVCSIYSKTVYKCASVLKIDTCHLHETTKSEEETIYIHYVDACSKGKICIDTERTELPIAPQCVKFQYPLHEGEKCFSPIECLSGLCTSNKCAASSEGTKCSERRNCKVGTYCKGSDEDSMVCTKYAGKDEACGSSNPECRPGLRCVENKCVAMFSLDNGAASSGYDDACKSGISYDTATGPQCGKVKKVGTCSRCDTTQDVTITFSSDETIKCNCPGTYSERYSCESLKQELDLQKVFDEYIKEFTDNLDDILDDDDYLEYYMFTHDDDTFGIKNLKEKYVEYNNFYQIASASEDDKDCVRDFFVRQLSSNKLYISLFGLVLFIFALF